MDDFAGADAKHHVVGIVIVPAQEMDVIGRDQPDAEIFRDPRQHCVAPSLFFDPVIVHLDEEILRAQDVTIFRGSLLRLFDVIGLNRGIHFAGKTAAKAD